MSVLDEATQKTVKAPPNYSIADLEIMISFSESQRMVLDKHLQIQQLIGMDDLIAHPQGQELEGYSSDGSIFVDVWWPWHLQRPVMDKFSHS